MMEQEYLDMVNQLKVKFDEIDKSNNKLLKNDIEHKKVIMTCYGILRIMDITFHSDPEFILLLIQTLRGMLSEGVIVSGAFCSTLSLPLKLVFLSLIFCANFNLACSRILLPGPTIPLTGA